MTKKIALVTGASRGIGKAIAQRLAEDGFFVVGTATSDSGAEAISAFLGENGTGKKLNVANAESIAEFIKAVNDDIGTPAVLVNNAGITRDNLLVRMSEEEWDDVLATNLKSVFRLSRAVLRPMMKARQGRIINISSVIGSTGNPGQANYAASKAGLIGFSKSLAREIGSRNITVNCIAPGFIETDMTEAMSAEQREKLLRDVPLQRLGQVSDIAAAVVFLAGVSAAYITGATLHVNGGLHME